MTFHPGIVRTLIKSMTAVAVAATLAGCAPDSLNNIQATGFNAYLSTLQNDCPNLRIGGHDIHAWLQYNGGVPSNLYDYWLDMTSRLYYGEISFAEYKGGVSTFLDGGPSDDASFACIARHLPKRDAR